MRNIRKIPRIHLIGCRLQETATTIKEANERMAQTCSICSKRGGVSPCSSCVVLDTHHYVVYILKTLAEVEEYRRRYRKCTYIIKGTITLDMQIKEV